VRELWRLLLAMRVWAFAASVPLIARLGPRRLARLMPGRVGRMRPGTAEVVERTLARRPPLVREGCLVSGLTRLWFLRRAGLDVRLAFGIGRPGGEVAGHCWLVLDGAPYLERVDPRPLFTETYSIPPR
jgi:hypothetical protein